MLLFQFRDELELSVEFSPQLNFHYKHTQITTDILNSYMSNDFFFCLDMREEKEISTEIPSASQR